MWAARPLTPSWRSSEHPKQWWARAAQSADRAGRLGHHRRRHEKILIVRRPSSWPNTNSVRASWKKAGSTGRHTPALADWRRGLAGQHRTARRHGHAVAVGAVGYRPVSRSSFCSWAVSPRADHLPTRKSSTRPYPGGSGHAEGLPVTIRTVDIGSDKPLDRSTDHRMDKARNYHLNPALGRGCASAGTWPTADVLTQLRTIWRAAARADQPAGLCWHARVRLNTVAGPRPRATDNQGIATARCNSARGRNPLRASRSSCS
jgi:hypothetical protein